MRDVMPSSAVKWLSKTAATMHKAGEAERCLEVYK